MIPAGEYAFPLPNGNVISPYGGRRRHHSGVDIKTCANDTIVSAFDGIVRMAKPFAAYGNVIVVRHSKKVIVNIIETIATTPRTWLNPEIVFSPDNRSP